MELFQGVASVSNNVELRELGRLLKYTASYSQDVVEGGCRSNAPRSKVPSSGLTLI